MSFRFSPSLANLPRWAVGSARGVHRDADGWIVETGHGDVPIRIQADHEKGTIDFHMGIGPGVEAIAYSRLMPNDDSAEYVFTQFRQPGMSDEVFAGQRAALAEELALLPILFRARAVCPAGQ